MARKTTYMYEIKATKPGEIGLTFYAYARNQRAAVDWLKQMDNGMLKTWRFAAKCFGEADYDKYPDLVRLFDEAEKETVLKGGYASADAYARRKDKPGSFISADDLKDLLDEGEKEE